MAPIKSSIDLAMERTEGLRLSAEERQRQRRREAAEMAAGLVRRWQEEDLNEERLAAEVRSKETAFPELRQQMMEQAVRCIGVQMQNPSLLELLRFLDEDKARQCRTIIDSYRQEAESRKHGLREAARGELLQQGVSGTAIEPNETGWQEWRSWIELQEQAMQEALLGVMS